MPTIVRESLVVVSPKIEECGVSELNTTLTVCMEKSSHGVA